jgi:hypothetical protein
MPRAGGGTGNVSRAGGFLHMQADRAGETAETTEK